jgi:hypothetical protein
MQMFYQQTVAPYLQLANYLTQNAVSQYQQQVSQEMNLPYMKNSPAAKALLAQAPAQEMGAQLMNAALTASTAAAPAADQLMNAIGTAWQQGILNAREYVTALGNYAGSQSTGIPGLNINTVTGTPQFSLSQAQSSNPLANTPNIQLPQVPASTGTGQARWQQLGYASQQDWVNAGSP